MEQNTSAFDPERDETAVEVRRRRRGSPLGRLARLCLKELREILRDRRTIVTLVLMPLLVYPLLSLCFQRLLLTSLGSSRSLRCIIGVAPEQEIARVQRFVGLGDVLLRPAGEEQPAAHARTAPLPKIDDPDEPSLQIEWVTGPHLEQQVAAGAVDLGILVRTASPADRPVGFNTPLRAELVYRKKSAISEMALDYLQRRFRAVNDQVLEERLQQLRQRWVLPAQVTSRSVGGSGAAFSLTTLIPLVLILMTITGAVYPAIDLTAGERERGTLEALMAAPVPRLGLLAAKYVAVVVVALLTAAANLLAMTITLVTSGLGAMLFGESGISPLLVLQIFALLILFASFFSAVLLALTSFARSFKEAQAYLIPVMLLCLAPGLMSLMPGIEFGGVLAVMPLVNIVLLARDLFEGGVNPALATVAVLSTAFYAAAAIGVAARVFGTDAILYGSQATWADLFRRPAPRRVATVSGAMTCLAVLFPCYFVATGLLGQVPYNSVATPLVLNGIATVILFAGFPLVAAIIQRLPLRDVFQWRMPRPWAVGGAALLGIGLWPLVHEVYLLNEVIGLTALSEERIKEVSELLENWRQVSPLLILAVGALAPAVCEELLFRGYLLRALLAGTTVRNAIVGSAVLFGLFHIPAMNLLAAERFLPSAFLGLILGWVCWRTGSVVPGMVLHVCHNGLLLMLSYYQKDLAERGWGIQEQSHMPVTWLVAAGIALVAGLTTIWFGGKSQGDELVTMDGRQSGPDL